MKPSQLPDAPAQLLLVNRRHRYVPALSVAVLTAYRQARRCDTRNRSCRTQTALRRRSELRSFTRKNPTDAPGLRLEHRFVQLCIHRKTLDANILLLQLPEEFGLGCCHPSLQLLRALIGWGRHLLGTTADICDALALVEQLLSGA